MKTKTFEDMIDRFGADLGRWPVAEAERANRLLETSADAKRLFTIALGVETALRLTRPAVDPARAARIQRLALAEIARREASPSLLQRCLAFFAMPIPRVAMAIALTAIGFSVGAAVGNPSAGNASNPAAVPLITASTDDVVY